MPNQNQRLLLVLLIFLIVTICQAKHSYKNEDPTSLDRSIIFHNRSGKIVEVHWVNPQTNELILQSSPDIKNGALLVLNSFIGHTFQIRELPSTKTGACASDICSAGFTTVSEYHEQVAYIDPGMKIVHHDSKTLAEDHSRDAITFCASEIKEKSNSASEAVDMMSECVLDKLATQIQALRDEIYFQTEIRQDLSYKLENYTCADMDLPSTESIENITWTSNGIRRNVQKLLNRDASKIYVVDNFITAEECQAMETAAKPSLRVATVADGEGGHRVTLSRKAMQAGIAVPWHEESFGNPIAALSRRVYDFTNSVTGFNLAPDGQEDLMSIQYFGENYENGEEPDRYTPHCDGDCNGNPHVTGNRVATMVMYCEVPEIGGATQFGNVGIHIKPKVGMATFFSYMGPDKRMDNGFTMHSGCPVLKGNKKIVTQWMRYGVSNENPWSSFNTLGVQNSDDA